MRLKGLDYSEPSIALCRKACPPDIIFEQMDFLAPSIEKKDFHTVTCLVDKGTLDAMTLNPESSPELSQQHSAEKIPRCDAIVTLYRKTLGSLLVPLSSFFMITSCNWTKEELLRWFDTRIISESPLIRLHYLEQIPHPAFHFGGSSGQTVTTLIFTTSLLEK